jgi:hypothetical protein
MLARFPTAGDLITTGDLASISDQKRKPLAGGPPVQHIRSRLGRDRRSELRYEFEID